MQGGAQAQLSSAGPEPGPDRERRRRSGPSVLTGLGQCKQSAARTSAPSPTAPSTGTIFGTTTTWYLTVFPVITLYELSKRTVTVPESEEVVTG